MPNVDNGLVQNRETGWGYELEDQNLIRQKNLFRCDISLQRRLFYDACLHSGYKVEYFEAEREQRDLYYDTTVLWKESIILPCIFDDTKNIKILKNLGWFAADQEIQPNILYLPMYKKWETKEILDLQDQSLFRINYFGQNYPVDFRLSEKRRDSVYGIYWICKLAPEYLDNFYYITDHGSHYLKRKKDNTSSCEHKKSEEYKQDNRRYQNEDLEAYLFGKKGEKVSDQRPYEIQDLTSNNQEGKTYEQLIMEDD